MSAPLYRKGKSQDLAHGMAEYVQELIAECRAAFPTCLTCVHFVEDKQWCMKYGGHPPPRVIVNACAGYTDTDEIPF